MEMPRVSAASVEEYSRPGLWRDRLVDSYLDEAARGCPDDIAVVAQGRRITYRVLHQLARRVAAGLAVLGVRKGEVVSFQLPNWLEALALHYGILKAGAVSNPIIPIYRHRELEFILRQAQTKVAVIPGRFRGFDYPAMFEDIRSGLPELKHLLVVGGTAPGMASFDDFLHEAWEQQEAGTVVARMARSANDPMLLLYTSGTTAEPKGAVHTHNTLDYENRSIIEFFALTGSDVVFMPSPVTHITGVLYGLQLPVMLGTKVVFQDVWEPGEALKLIAEERCSFTVSATPFLHALTYHPELANHDLGSLRIFACGGADVSPELIRAATERLGCCAARVYGSTEYPTLTASGPEDPLEKRARTDGRIIGAARARVVDDSGHPLPPGQEGEIVARGPEMFLGYLNPALNAEAFDPDGWFRTGDLAVLSTDGYIEIKGRKKDIIIRGGENISAKEVEDLLLEHPKVKQVAIVAMPDPVLVERACAFVVTKGGEALTLEEVVAFLKTRRIAMQKLPERLEVVPALPMTASGKIQKFKLRDQIKAELAEGRARQGGERAARA